MDLSKVRRTLGGRVITRMQCGGEGDIGLHDFLLTAWPDTRKRQRRVVLKTNIKKVNNYLYHTIEEECFQNNMKLSSKMSYFKICRSFFEEVTYPVEKSVVYGPCLTRSKVALCMGRISTGDGGAELSPLLNHDFSLGRLSCSDQTRW